MELAEDVIDPELITVSGEPGCAPPHALLASFPIENDAKGLVGVKRPAMNDSGPAAISPPRRRGRATKRELHILEMRT
jgi:hypothetical protein